MSTSTLRVDSLVLYKQRPARISLVGDKKLEIQTDAGDTISLRPKDVVLLHPGPLKTLRDLKTVEQPSEEILTAWELLADSQTTLPELAELAFEAFTPQHAWTIWQLVADGLYFSGSPDELKVHSADLVAAIQTNRAAKAAEEAAWQQFLRNIRSGKIEVGDEKYLHDTVGLALEQRNQSSLLRQVGQSETSQNAHALLLQCGYWTPQINPYPQRMKQSLDEPDFPLPPLPAEERRDLTELLALAIDDEGSQDPDDAVSWVGTNAETGGDQFWVHIADVAALIHPDSPADLEARDRAANLYLPEGTVPMLPTPAQDQLALGLREISPALSFLLELAADGDVQLLDLTPSWIKVTRMSYAEAENRIEADPFRQLYALSQRFTQKRIANGAVELNLPEAKIRVKDGEVVIVALPALRSRDLVRDAMLMTGEAVARYAIAQQLALPFSTQDANPEAEELPRQSLSEMFALRRFLKPSRQQTEPAPHSGLGLKQYVQATSPLRRYGDLLVHQQLRAHLRHDVTLSAGQISERLAVAGENSRTIRQCERISNQHWTLVYLLAHPDWQGEAVVAEKVGNRAVLLIPALAFEFELYGHPELMPDDTVALAVPDVNLPELSVRFRSVERKKR